jgi:hypothetical protein
MAAWTLIAGAVPAMDLAARADDRPAVAHPVKIELRIAGLGRGGCDVEVKPGHAGCRFRPLSRHVDSSGKATLMLDDVQALTADRDCAFAITIREPGHAAKTVLRGLRLPEAAAGGASIRTLPCFLSAPSLLARNTASRLRR